ncbi:MAG: hypothetical protein ACP5NR_07730 [Athalassotoga sp.]
MKKLEKVLRTIEKTNEEEPPAYCCESAEIITGDTIKELITHTSEN